MTAVQGYQSLLGEAPALLLLAITACVQTMHGPAVSLLSEVGHSPMLAPWCLSSLRLPATALSQPSACCQRHGLHGCADLTMNVVALQAIQEQPAVCLVG